VSDNCGGTQNVQFKVQTQNTLLSWLLSTVFGATITGTRSANDGCSTPVTTSFSTDLVSGLLSGPIAYGSWSFTAATSSGTAGVSSAINAAGPANLTLTANYSSCPTGSLTATLNTSTTTAPSTLVGYSGVVTATPGASTCGGATQQLTMTNGTLTSSLPYGDWTLSAGTSSKAITINSATTTAAMPLVTFNCTPTPTVTVPLSDTAGLLGTYKVRATYRSGCTGTAQVDDTFTNLLGLLGSGSFSLKQGIYDFTLLSPSTRTIDTAASDQVTSVMVTGNSTVKIVVH
jgi:hypothetical protein